MDEDTEWIKNRKDFVAYIRLLLEEMETGEIAYEPESAGDLLEAIGAYANDVHGSYKNMGIEASPEEPTWQLFAQIVAGALIYE
ncbi:MAG: hypothetical protein HC881_15285 [Leptolyngbyaceae cyanobacterium SL_7_1]|nr:hypothetical protein [Leptolyngbyaceae cyanobacterium SL_7_1]